MHVETGPNAKKLFGIMPKFAEMLANEGNNFIIDEVLFDHASLRGYAKSLKSHTVYYIGIFCDLSIIQEREFLRRDRCIGLSNNQIDRVHQGKIGFYDLKVDTSNTSPFDAARQILKFVDSNTEPKVLKNSRRLKTNRLQEKSD